MRAGGRLGRSSVLLSWAFLSSLALTAQPGPPARDEHGRAATPPQTFELNRGQAETRTLFVSRADGLLFRLDPAGIDIDLGAVGDTGAPDHARLVFTGSSPDVRPAGLEPLEGTVSYFAGADPNGWIRDVPTWGAVRYRDLYPGVDLTVRGDHRRLTLAFSLAKEADPDTIAIAVEPAEAAASLRLQRSGGRREVLYVIDRAPGAPDDANPSSARTVPGITDEIARVVVDGDGTTWVAGRSLAPLPPTGLMSGAEAFVARVDRDGRSPAWVAWFGGAGPDLPLGLAAAEDGSVVVAGRTDSPDFPLVHALAAQISGPSDAFALRVDPDGASLRFSTYLGGAGEDEARDVALDSDGNAWVAGTGSGGAMLAVLSSAGDRILRRSAEQLTAQAETLDAIVIDAAGDLHAAGSSARHPFLATMSTDGSGPVGMVTLAVPEAARSTALALDGDGTAYVVGRRAPEAPGAPERGFAAVVPAGSSPEARMTLLDRVPLAAVATDETHAWIAGEELRGPRGRRTAFIARLAATDAAVDRVRPIAGTAMARATGIALDPDNRPIVAGIELADADGGARLFTAAAGGGLVAVRPVPEGSISPAAAGCPGTIRFDNSAGTGLWQTATNWNTDLLPGAADDVCIPAGMNVTLNFGTSSIGSLFVESGASLGLTAPTLTLASTSQVDGTLAMSAGGIAGNANLTLNGTFNWSGGALTGAGTTEANNGIAISGGQVKDVTTSRVLNTHGTVTWTGTGSVRLLSGGTIHNLGTWDARSDASLTQVTAPALFDNPTGSTFKKTLGAGTTTVTAPWSGDGAVSVESGTVSFNGGGSSNGSFTGLGGTTLGFGGGSFTLGTASVVNVPNVSVAVGDLTVNGSFTSTVSSSSSQFGTWTFNPAATLVSIGPSLSIGGTLVLNSGEAVNVTSLTETGGSRQGTDTLSVSGTFAWSGGSLNGAATTNANGPLAISSASVKDLTGGHVLNTKAATTWTGSGSIRLGGGALIRNTAAWEAQSDASITTLTGGGSFDNQAGATFTKKVASGTTSLNVPITNSGTITAETGTISFGGGGSGPGTYSGLAGATLLFSAGSYTLDAVATLNAANVAMTNGTVSVLGSFTASSTTTVGPGSMTFEPSATLVSLGALSVSSLGALDLRSGETVNLPTLTCSGGSISGTDVINVAGTVNWSGGSISGAAAVNANGGMALTSVSVKDLLGGRTLNTSGTVTWSGTGSIRLGGGSLIRNTSAWEAQSDAQITNLAGGGSFDNQPGATFTKKVATGTTAVNIPITNSGTITAETGTISFGGGGSGPGTYSGLAGTTLLFAAGNYTLDAAATLNAPNVAVTGGTLSVLGSFTASSATAVSSGMTFEPSATLVSLGALSVSTFGALDLRSGETVNLPTLSLSGGAISGTDVINVAGLVNWSGGNIGGAADFNANGGMAITSISVKDLVDGRTLNASGTVTWSGTGAIRTRASSIRNAGLWLAQSDAQMTDSLGAGGVFDNLAGATFRKTAGSGTTEFTLPLLNHGTVEIQSGTITVSDSGNSSGALTGTPGTAFVSQLGTFSLDFGSTFQVPNVTVMSTGAIDAHGSFAAASATTAANAGTLTLFPEATVTSLGSALAVTGGTLDLRSGETIDVTTLSLTAGTLKGSDTVNVSGALTWSGGAMTQAGIVNANGGGTLSGISPKDITAGRTLNTAGTLTWTGAGMTRMGTGAVIHNSGTWNVQTDAAISNSLGGGVFDNQAAGTFQRSSGAATMNITTDFSNAGAVRVQTGTLQFSTSYTQTAGSLSLEGGALLASVPLQIQGGSLAGSGTVTGNVTMNGHLAPGLSPGSLTITGTLAPTASSAFDVEIGGLTPATEHDRALLNSAVALTGTLNVSLVNGFLPADLNTFTIMTFPSATGTFPTVNFPPLPGGMVWQIFYNPTSIVLKTINDLDGDGVSNLVDCAPNDASAWSIPAEVTGVSWTNNTTIAWTSLSPQAGPGTTYDLMRGLVGQPIGGGAAETCLAVDSGSTNFVDATLPALGKAFYYLVRGGNNCGTGNYGTTSGGAPRNTAACP
jgi:hypothetical protein